MGWSSTISTWIGVSGSRGAFIPRLWLRRQFAMRNPELDCRSGSRHALNAAPSAGERRALAHQTQADVPRAFLNVSRAVADAVVDDPRQAAAAYFLQLNVN